MVRVWNCGECDKSYVKFDGLHKHVNAKHPAITNRAACIVMVNKLMELRMAILLKDKPNNRWFKE